MSKQNTTLEERQRNDWIRLIQRILERANVAQLRDIYLLLCGYLGGDNQ